MYDGSLTCDQQRSNRWVCLYSSHDECLNALPKKGIIIFVFLDDWCAGIHPSVLLPPTHRKIMCFVLYYTSSRHDSKITLGHEPRSSPAPWFMIQKTIMVMSRGAALHLDSIPLLHGSWPKKTFSIMTSHGAGFKNHFWSWATEQPCSVVHDSKKSFSIMSRGAASY